MKEYQTLNNFEEGKVCPTHDCFSVWDKVWIMDRNKPREVRIVGVIIRGFHRVGWQDFGLKKELFVKYKINKNIQYYDFSNSDEIPSKLLYPTKESLLNSLNK